MPLWLHVKPKQVGKGCEREKLKIILPFHSYPRGDRKFQKKGKKFKKFKNTIVVSLQAKIGWKWPRKSENENCRFVSFRPEA